MAITTSTFKVNAGWASSDVITQMEQAMTSLGWQGSEISGYIVGIGTIIGGGDTNAADYYEDVRPKSTTGVGTQASFAIYRDTVGIRRVMVNRPGVGYTSGEIVTVSADDIGGFSNGATDLSFSVCVDETVGNGTTVAIALTTIIYHGNGDAGNTYSMRFGVFDADRVGVVGYGHSIITVREGDTVSIANSYSNSYDPAIVLPHIYEQSVAAVNTSHLAGLDINILTTEGYSQYTFKIGQAGTYLIKSGNSNLGPECGRVVVLPWSGESGDRTVLGFGTNTSFWEKNLASDRPWGVQKHQIASNKLYGHTYRSFRQDNSNGNLDIWSFNGYMHDYPNNRYEPSSSNGQSSTQFYHGGTGWRSRVAGASNLDFSSENIGGQDNSLLSHVQDVRTHDYNKLASVFYGTNYGFDLDLNLFKSAIDPRFVVFSYRNPTVSSTHLTNNTFSTFFFHNFDCNLWDYDHVFLSGMTEIIPNGPGNTTYPELTFRTRLSSNYNLTAGGGQKRAAEFPYQEYVNSTYDQDNYVDTYYSSQTYKRNIVPYAARLYYRSEDEPITFRGGNPWNTELTANDRVSPEANFNAVIKGIPLNVTLIPCPYYLPDDFGLIEFYYNAANANIQQGDTFTISPSEVWTVITASYNQTTVTRGIAFCARTV